MPVPAIPILIVVVCVLAIVWFFVTYNKFQKLMVAADEGFSDIDVQLKRRHDLIPNLVETVKGYATHERGTLEEVTAARAAAVNASGTAAKAEAEGELSQVLSRLMAVSEAYPDLKANTNFLALQQELSATEDRIQASRRFYNSTVTSLNTMIRTFPAKLLAGMAHATSREFFEVDTEQERAAPEVKF